MREYFLKHKDNIIKLAIFLALVLVLFLFVKILAPLIAPLIVGYILCVILYPLAVFLRERLRFPKALSSIVCIALLLVCLVFGGVGIFGKIGREAKDFVKNSPEIIQRVTENIDALQAKFENLTGLMPIELQDRVDEVFISVLNGLPSVLGNAIKNFSVNIATHIPSFVLALVLGFIACYFFMNDRENVEAFIVRQIPDSIKKRLRAGKKGVFKAVGGYIKAELTLMCIVALICILGLTILGYPYSLLMGVLIAIVDALPVFGSGLFFWPWCAYSLITGDFKMAVGLIIINLTVLLTRQMLEPRLLGDRIGVHPLATLMAIFAGLKIFGVFGFIIGPIVLVTINAMQDADLLPKWK